MVDFREGVKFYLKNQDKYVDSFLSTKMSEDYIDSINNEINKFTKDINERFTKNSTPLDKLKGNAAEEWHAGTYKINSVLNNNNTIKVEIPKSNKYASVDIKVNEDDLYSLKYYKTAKDSVNQQAKSNRQYFNEKYNNSEISYEDFVSKKNISNLPDDPMYKNQKRIIPSDQLEEGKKYANNKTVIEKGKRPDQVLRYEDTKDNLTDRIRDEKGNESKPLSKEQAEHLAKKAQKGKFDPKDFNLTSEELVEYKHIFKQAFKAGTTAITISAAMKTAPEIYNAIKYLLETGEVDEKQFKKIGYAAMQGGQEGFLRGFISASIVSCCESGKWGSVLKGVDPSIIGVATVLAVNTLKNATEVAKGDMSRGEMVNELIKDLFVTTGAMSLGAITQEIIPIPVLGFMIGSFAGSMVGTFVYNAGYSTVMSFFVESGITIFGLVEQDYELPENVLEEMGIETFNFDRIDCERLELEKFVPKTCDVERFVPDTFEPEEFNIRYLRRGVIEINRIGYVA